jgi:transcriptional regulator with XRE-family HTH domain
MGDPDAVRRRATSPGMSGRFAANLRSLREAAGLSQEETAFRAAIHRTQVSLLEGGRRMPRVSTLVRLAGSLGVTPNDLLDGIAWEPVVSVGGGLVVTHAERDG